MGRMYKWPGNLESTLKVGSPDLVAHFSHSVTFFSFSPSCCVYAFSRQRYVLGDGAMQRMAKSSVLLYGVGGLGIEIGIAQL